MTLFGTTIEFPPIFKRDMMKDISHRITKSATTLCFLNHYTILRKIIPETFLLAMQDYKAFHSSINESTTSNNKVASSIVNVMLSQKSETKNSSVTTRPNTHSVDGCSDCCGRRYAEEIKNSNINFDGKNSADYCTDVKSMKHVDRDKFLSDNDIYEYGVTTNQINKKLIMFENETGCKSDPTAASSCDADRHRLADSSRILDKIRTTKEKYEVEKKKDDGENERGRIKILEDKLKCCQKLLDREKKCWQTEKCSVVQYQQKLEERYIRVMKENELLTGKLQKLTSEVEKLQQKRSHL
ncbi:hypothetical protein HELRODRAFT_175832 [Helobdella robusta]|uniref:Uncharacterized protein n=1 Tax=Helobdella robusta TaxID=6412 RepID=T1F9Q7_HELRO|nr:hypothetical protein HELRODRAFT_175832 [Helobdella robusta]ESO00412.1 hypothetical protein HELRODRAFT_175832 [Helobdella robusta]